MTRREVVQIVEIVQPLCALTFGNAPCTATGEKCYNTRATCEDTANYDGSSTLSLFFAKGRVAEMGVKGVPYIIPSLVSVSTAPTRINLTGANPDAQGLGNRAVASIEFKDHPHTDRRVDPYVSERAWDPYLRGSFWSKWLVRNKFRQNIEVRVYEGYADQKLSQMTKRSYFLQSVSGPDSSGSFSIEAKDILARIEDRKAQCPVASPGELFADLDATTVSFVVANAVLADYGANGTLRINDELMTYTSRATEGTGLRFSGVTRGTEGTEASEHSAEDTVQQCVRFTDARLDDIANTLLGTYGGIDASYLDTVNWASEVDDYLSLYRFSTVISEPTSVSELISELQVSGAFYMFWDERDALVKFKAIRGIEADLPLLSDRENIVADSFDIREKPRERASQVWVYYGHKNFVDPIEEASSYKFISIFANLESESDDQYGEPSIRKVFSRWITTGAIADSTASKISVRYSEVPSEVVFRMDAKDRATWVGDQRRMTHYRDVDKHGNRRVRNWTIVSAEEVVPGEMVEYVAEDTTLYGRISKILANGSADYDPLTAVSGGAYIGDANGLLSDGTNCARIA